MAIQVLDTQTANRIAAGEVVERPASIVKELCENALDAGATSISIEILGGGIERIRITDNGCGMTREDLSLCLRRHATSKIRSGDPLTDIQTLGFRGEALPSIASVSRLSISSRTRGAEAGAQLTCEGGGEIAVQAFGCPEGTQVTVADLFYNTPARRAFLRRPATEAAAVSDVVTAVLLGNPGVAVQFTNQKRMVFASPGDGKLQSAVRCALGAEAAARMIPVRDCRDGIAIDGLLGVAELARANRSGQLFFVNGRPVRSLILQQALEYACGERVTTGRFAQCVLSVALENAAVDVNVHPNKLEVRFREGERVRLAVADAVRDALLEATHRERFMGSGMEGAGQGGGRAHGNAGDARRVSAVQQSMMGAAGAERGMRAAGSEAEAAGSETARMGAGPMRAAGEARGPEAAGSEAAKPEAGRMGAGPMQTTAGAVGSGTGSEGTVASPTRDGSGEYPGADGEGLRESFDQGRTRSEETAGKATQEPRMGFQGAGKPADAPSSVQGNQGDSRFSASPTNAFRSQPSVRPQGLQVSPTQGNSLDTPSEATTSSDVPAISGPSISTTVSGLSASSAFSGPSASPTMSSADGGTDAPTPESERERDSTWEPDAEIVSEPEPEYTLLGVFQSTYLVVASGDSLYYIDQHAAHERILFDRFMRDYDSGAVSQPLLTPIVLNLSLRERAVVQQNAELLAELGFELEAVGEGMFLRAVPHILGQPQAEGFFREWLDRLEEWRPGRPIEMRRDAVIKLACRRAIKAGDSLSDAEARALIRRMLRGDVITCPHGRPVYLRVTRRELEKRFGRA